MIELPFLNRRRLLLGLAAASTAAAVPVAVNAAVEPAAENARLIALGDSLGSLVDAYNSAREVRRAVIAHWEPLWPSAPEAITNGLTWQSDHFAEKGLRGETIDVPGERRPRFVYRSVDFADRAKDCRQSIVRRRPRHPLSMADIMALEAEATQNDYLAAMASAYERECEAIRTASGYADAKAALNAAADVLEQAVTEIMDAKACTMVGVVIKAQALAAWHTVEPLQGMLPIIIKKWDAALATAILSIAEAQAA